MLYCGPPGTVREVMLKRGIGLAALCDPDLEIDLLLAERQIVAFDTANHAAAEILYVGHVARQIVIGIRQQQVRGRHRSFELLLQVIDELVDGGPCRKLNLTSS